MLTYKDGIMFTKCIARLRIGQTWRPRAMIVCLHEPNTIIVTRCLTHPKYPFHVRIHQYYQMA